jgi:hypothetical protein
MTAKIYGPGTSKKEKGKIVAQGMGGFLTPPGHPEHSYSVQTDLRRRPWNRGSMSLSFAATCEWLDPFTKRQAKDMLDRWQRERPGIALRGLAIKSDLLDWVQQVLGYFRGCYRNPSAPADKQWDCGNLIIDQKRNPLDYIGDHAGVNLIRRYYPEYVPTPEDFAGAYWGTKPEKAIA